MTTQLHHFALSDDGVPSDSLVLTDGSIWSHAATLGTYTKGNTFTIDQALITSIVRNFKKAPVDYEHSTVSREAAEARAAGKAPKAGDIVELKGVLSAADFTGDLKTAAEKLAAKAGRPLDDARNLGLWMRWRPTARALSMIKANEYSELSIAFDEEYVNNRGEQIGATLYSVALTNLPFLDDMLPVAASRDAHPERHRTPREDDMSTPNVRLLTAVAAVAALAVAPTDEDQAEKQLTAAIPDINRFRAFARDVGTELGEVEAPKAVEKIRALKQEVADFRRQADEAKKAQITLSVSTTIKEHEKKIPNKRMRDLFTRELTRELEAGVALDKTETLATLKELPADPNQRQTSAGDSGDAAPSEDQRLVNRVEELMKTDADVAEKRKLEGYSAAYSLACDKAEAELLTATKK